MNNVYPYLECLLMVLLAAEGGLFNTWGSVPTVKEYTHTHRLFFMKKYKKITAYLKIRYYTRLARSNTCFLAKFKLPPGRARRVVFIVGCSTVHDVKCRYRKLGFP